MNIWTRLTATLAEIVSFRKEIAELKAELAEVKEWVHFQEPTGADLGERDD